MYSLSCIAFMSLMAGFKALFLLFFSQPFNTHTSPSSLFRGGNWMLLFVHVAFPPPCCSCMILGLTGERSCSSLVEQMINKGWMDNVNSVCLVEESDKLCKLAIQHPSSFLLYERENGYPSLPIILPCNRFVRIGYI